MKSFIIIFFFYFYLLLWCIYLLSLFYIFLKKCDTYLHHRAFVLYIVLCSRHVIFKSSALLSPTPAPLSLSLLLSHFLHFLYIFFFLLLDATLLTRTKYHVKIHQTHHLLDHCNAELCFLLDIHQNYSHQNHPWPAVQMVLCNFFYAILQIQNVRPTWTIRAP